MTTTNLTFTDAISIIKELRYTDGGYFSMPECEAYHIGIQTAISALEKARCAHEIKMINAKYKPDYIQTEFVF